jgi:UDP-N-acetyl-D-glucosamine/UDP-N-acetyl-D-galactosamine dehydrogenase
MEPRPILCIVGLGYVGLPLAHAFAKKGYEVHGFDISEKRIAELKDGHDRTRELSKEELREATIHFGTDPSVIGKAKVIIVAVPTPVDAKNKPDLSYVESSARIVGKHISKGAIVVYEATVYPGVTEELCGPIIAQESGLAYGRDFTMGYSPERINPGDKLHTVTKILKIVSGQDEETLERLARLYGDIVEAGIHKAPSIKVAEMAKAIENAQRDLNIAYVNEVAMLCNHVGIKTKDVLEAAGTKWNFLKFQPGLVGGHCIGVDPYYLVEKAKMLGMTTHVITAGRAVNDGMSGFIVDRIALAMDGKINGSRMLVLGLTFKEDVPDTRNSKVEDVVKALEAKGATVEAHDPFVSEEEMKRMNVTPGSLENGPYDAVLLFVPHKEYRETALTDLVRSVKDGGIVYDLKSLLNGFEIEKSGRMYLCL